ncbi:MAG: hypothetical protein ACOYJZ_04765 [Acutalibacter sp.]
MNKQSNLDERQLWQRGNVFKHVLIYFIAALAAEAFFQNLELRWAESGWEMILILWGGITLCWWEYILRDIRPMGKEQNRFFLILGVCGVCILLLTVCLMMSGQGEGFLQGTMLSQRGAIVLVGVMMISILGVNLVKSQLEKRRIQEDED